MKRLLSLFLLISICLSFAACSVDTEKYTVASAKEKRETTYKDAQNEDYIAFLEKLDSFSSKLAYGVYSDSDKLSNLCISPISVYMALALACECADGETRSEILNALGLSYEEVYTYTKYLYAFSNKEFNYTNLLGNKKASAFEDLSNSLWIDKDVQLKKDGIDRLAYDYNCDIFGVSFKDSSASKAINQYIKDKTHGIIDGNLDISRETLFTLINTFYLKEIWNEYGDELKLTDEKYDFMNVDGSKTRLPLLTGYYSEGNIYKGEGFSSFFTETEHGFKIKFILPDDNYSIDEVFTEEKIYKINNVSDYGYIDEENKLLHHTRVIFPEYKADFDGSVTDTLKDNFGIKSLFSMGDCDFSGITDDKVACDGVIHKCTLEVNRKGIEGAAVTIMPMAGATGPLEGYTKVYHDLIIDRAFGFVICDRYGAVLFSGVINTLK